MDKRYQVFLSSTYADLRDERQRVLQTLMEMDCIPAGMELFPAADEEQWAFIRQIIDDCDYYLLIIGGRYGSLTAEGVSYTEKEFDYACEKGIRVVAFLHESPEEISVAKSDVHPSARAKLEAFRAKVANGRLVKFWGSADELIAWPRRAESLQDDQELPRERLGARPACLDRRDSWRTERPAKAARSERTRCSSASRSFSREEFTS
jgi:hypothetical protein